MLRLVFAALARVAILGEASACPNPQALGRALTAILPDVTLSQALEDGAIAVRIEDAGERYRITVGDVRREWVDASRRCDERARVAAVVVALAIQPPQVEAEAPLLPLPPASDSERAPIELPRPAPPRKVLPSRPAVVDVAALLSLSPGADGGVLPMGGVAVRAAFGRTFALVLGAAMVTPARIELLQAQVDLIRIPFDLGVRVGARRGRAETAGEIGVRPSLLLLNGAGMGGDRLDVALGATAGERYWWSERAAVFAAVDVDVSLRPYDLLILPDQVAGQTPRLWLGLSFGLAVRYLPQRGLRVALASDPTQAISPQDGAAIDSASVSCTVALLANVGTPQQTEIGQVAPCNGTSPELCYRLYGDAGCSSGARVALCSGSACQNGVALAANQAALLRCAALLH